ncbi:MAG: peptidase [Calditrichaeota bacterium]|nr:MAG: peptidase [Calditrichota bacterium]
MDKIIIGRKDKAEFPEFEISELDIKIDTGAYTSSIHCHHIEEKEIDGKTLLTFCLLDPSHPEYSEKLFKFSNYKRKLVKNSFGTSENRFILTTTIKIFGEIFPIELSLSERENMKYPVLIGRKLLNKRFIVDSTKTNLSHKLKTKKLKD